MVKLLCKLYGQKLLGYNGEVYNLFSYVGACFAKNSILEIMLEFSFARTQSRLEKLFKNIGEQGKWLSYKLLNVFSIHQY